MWAIQKPKFFIYCVMQYFCWGFGGNLKLITPGVGNIWTSGIKITTEDKKVGR